MTEVGARAVVLATAAWIALPAALGCASDPAAGARGGPPAAPREIAAGYPGRCSLLGLEVMSQSPTARGVSPGDLGTDTVELVATYRPGDSSEPTGPVAFSFRVLEESADDLQAHLAQHPEVACEREVARGGERRLRLEVPPFEDEHGNPVEPVQVGDAVEQP